MLPEIKFGQRIALNSRKFRVITVVRQELVCLETLEPGDVGVWVFDYGRVLREGQPLETLRE